MSTRLRIPTLPPLPLLGVLVGALALAACDGEPIAPGATEPITELPRELNASEVRLIEASNLFAFDLLREVVAESDEPNVFISPLSASMALGMAMNGAVGETWTQMADVLGFEGMEEQAINEGYRDLIALLLELDPQVQFGLGNSVWTDEGFTFLPEYMARLETYFHAEAQAVPFRDPASVDIINGWVADVTEGRIPALLDEIPPGMVAYLINAVYFKGDWRHRFDPDDTAPAPFTREDGSTVQVPMMAGKVARRTLVGPDGMQVVELPYGGDAFAAVAILPPRDGSLREMVADLDEGAWAEWMAQLDDQAQEARLESGPEPEPMLVRLPKLELDWRGSLIPPLQRMGMEDPFTRMADFSRMNGEGGLFIGQVLQKTFLKVDEEGTEAAAATAVGMRVTSAPPSFSFDRPFLFAIRERLTGTVLFIGAIGDPSA